MEDLFVQVQMFGTWAIIRPIQHQTTVFIGGPLKRPPVGPGDSLHWKPINITALIEKVKNKVRAAGTDIDLSHRACQPWWINRQEPRFNLWVSKSPLRKPYRASQHCVLTRQNISSGNFSFFLPSLSVLYHRRWQIPRSTRFWLDDEKWEQPLCVCVFFLDD